MPLKYRCYWWKKREYVKLHSIHFGTKKAIITYGNGNISIPFSQIALEQSTGLFDKNGDEIYEYDRIRIGNSDTVYTVECGRGVYVARYGDDPGDNVCLFHYYRKNGYLDCTIVGNIHEDNEIIEDVPSPYCPICDHCGETGCCGVACFLEKHVRGKTNCIHEDQIIDEIEEFYEYYKGKKVYEEESN